MWKGQQPAVPRVPRRGYQRLTPCPGIIPARPAMMNGVRQAVEILALVIAVAIVAGGARRAGLSAPLVLVVVGVVASLVPGVPEYRLDPGVVLIGVLPPLLYAAALRTSLVDVRANRQA